MKFMHITVHFEYADTIEKILDDHDIKNYVRYPMREGKDRDGKHFGTQIYPGNTTVYQVEVPEETVNPLLQELKSFKEAKRSHRHLEAIVLPVEQRLE